MDPGDWCLSIIVSDGTKGEICLVPRFPFTVMNYASQGGTCVIKMTYDLN